MKNIFMFVYSFVCICTFINTGWAQPLPLDWEKSEFFDDYRYARHQGVISDSDGNVYVIGEYDSSTITFDTVTLQNVPAENINLNSYQMAKTSVYLLKYNSEGTLLWAKSYGSDRADFARDIAIDNQGNVYITGTFLGTSITFDSFTLSNTYEHESIYTAKINPEGNVIWAKSAQGAYRGMIDSTMAYRTNVKGISVNASGKVYITGWFSATLQADDYELISPPTPNSGITPSFFLIQYSSNGEVSFAKSNQASLGNSFGFDVAVDLQDNIYISGSYSSANTYNLVINGYTLPAPENPVNNRSGFIAKFDASGSLLWAKNTARSGKMVQDYKGGVVIAEQTYYPDYTIALNKYNSDGNLVWEKVIDGNDIITFYGLAADTGGNIFVTGGNGDSNVGLGTITLPANQGPGTSFIVKYNSAGNTQWAFNFKSGYSYGLASNSQGNIYLSGEFFNTNSIYATTQVDQNGVYTAKLSGDSIPLSYNTTSQQLQSELLVYPNPVENILNIKTSEDDVYSFAIYNALGQAVINKVNQNQNQNNISINMSQLQAGYYMLEVNKKSGRSSHKIIKK